MFFLCGFSNHFFTLALCLSLAGIGMCSESAILSLVVDYFPRKVLTTILGVIGSFAFIGTGLAFILGGKLLGFYSNWHPMDGRIGGLYDWQYIFILISLPGLLFGFIIWFCIRESIQSFKLEKPQPLKVFFTELSAIFPPFTLIALKRSGGKPKDLLKNGCFAIICFGLAWGLNYQIKNPFLWYILAFGIYGFLSWVQHLKITDHATFSMIFHSKTLAYGFTGFTLISYCLYGFLVWFAPYLIRKFGVSASDIGSTIGIITAISGLLGYLLGGIIADLLRRWTFRATPYVGIISALAALIGGILTLSSETIFSAYFYYFFYSIAIAMWIGPMIAMSSDLVLPRMRTTTIAYASLLRKIGLALGPAIVGILSDSFGLHHALMTSLGALPIAIIFCYIASLYITSEEKKIMERAKIAGENKD